MASQASAGSPEWFLLLPVCTRSPLQGFRADPGPEALDDEKLSELLWFGAFGDPETVAGRVTTKKMSAARTVGPLGAARGSDISGGGTGSMFQLQSQVLWTTLRVLTCIRVIRPNPHESIFVQIQMEIEVMLPALTSEAEAELSRLT